MELPPLVAIEGNEICVHEGKGAVQVTCNNLSLQHGTVRPAKGGGALCPRATTPLAIARCSNRTRAPRTACINYGRVQRPHMGLMMADGSRNNGLHTIVTLGGQSTSGCATQR